MFRVSSFAGAVVFKVMMGIEFWLLTKIAIINTDVYSAVESFIDLE